VSSEELAEFLRTRRAAVHLTVAARDGLRGEEAGERAGLRREEVAERAGISADYYTQLEQNRTSRPSAQVVAALASALGMDEAQRAHLFRLADHPVRSPRPRLRNAEPALLRVLDQMDGVPAQVMTDLGETLAQNRLSLALFGDASRYTGARRSSYYRWFTDVAARRVFAEDTRERETRARVAELRATLARRADAPARTLVDQLRHASAEFAALWDTHDAATRFGDHKRLVGPTGLLEMSSQFLTTGASDQFLVVFTPVPHTDAAERLALIGAALDTGELPG
jgi:transcriptional regulator with XRE-family HTH domain